MKKLLVATTLLGCMLFTVAFAGGNSVYREYQLSRHNPNVTLTYEYKSFENLDDVIDDLSKYSVDSKLDKNAAEKARKVAYNKHSEYIAKYPKESELYISRSHYAPTQEAALNDLYEAIKLDPTNDLAYKALADRKFSIFFAKGYFYGRPQYHVPACKHNTKYYNRLHNSEELKEVIEIYDKAIAIRPQKEEYQLLRNATVWVMCDLDEARAENKKFIKTDNKKFWKKSSKKK